MGYPFYFSAEWNTLLPLVDFIEEVCDPRIMRALAFVRILLEIIYRLLGSSEKDAHNKSTVILFAILTPHIATIKWHTTHTFVAKSTLILKRTSTAKKIF